MLAVIVSIIVGIIVIGGSLLLLATSNMTIGEVLKSWFK